MGTFTTNCSHNHLDEDHFCTSCGLECEPIHTTPAVRRKGNLYNRERIFIDYLSAHQFGADGSDAEVARMGHLQPVTLSGIRTYLQKNKRTKLYSSINYIYHRLICKPPPNYGLVALQMLDEHIQIVAIWDRYRSRLWPRRRNFLNISFVLYCLLRRHSLPADTEMISVRSAAKIRQHNQIMAAIFRRLGWSFNPVLKR